VERAVPFTTGDAPRRLTAMRILLVSHYALPHTGGIEVVVDALARRFAAAGHEVTHLASSAVRAGEAHLDSADVPYRRVRIAALNITERALGVPYPLFAPTLPFAAWREVGLADVVHAHGVLCEGSVAALLAARARGKGTVVTEHVGEVPYESRLLRAAQSAAFVSIGRVVLRSARRVLVLNERVENEMRRLDRNAAIVRLWNGVDTELYRPAAGHEDRQRLRDRLGWAGSRKRLLLVGRLVEKKGVGIAAAAAAELGDDYELLLVGPGTVREPLPPNVVMTGVQPPSRVAEMYRAADALLLPSRGEGFPLAVQEALASGLPVFVPPEPELTALLAGCGEAAQFVAAEPSAIAEAVRRFFRNGVDVAGAAAAFARDRFSWQTIVEQHLRIYAATIRRRGGDARDLR
jgi:glycosyltransferase involved in cell wall biosynthesis